MPLTASFSLRLSVTPLGTAQASVSLSLVFQALTYARLWGHFNGGRKSGGPLWSATNPAQRAGAPAPQEGRFGWQLHEPCSSLTIRASITWRFQSWREAGFWAGAFSAWLSYPPENYCSIYLPRFKVRNGAHCKAAAETQRRARLSSIRRCGNPDVTNFRSSAPGTIPLYLATQVLHCSTVGNTNRVYEPSRGPGI